MASTARALHLGMRRCCAAAGPATTATVTASAAARASTAKATALGRRVSRHATSHPSTAAAGARRGFASKTGGSDGDGDAAEAAVVAEAEEQLRNLDRRRLNQSVRRLTETGRVLEQPPHNLKRMMNAPWNEGETDTDMVTMDDEDDNLQGRDVLTLAHAKLDEHRDRRHYARLAVWEMPLLAQFAKPFEPPTANMPLRFRYTTYMGEFHPAERKVVVEFCPADLDLTPVQQDKLRKLVGPRYNPEKDIIKMSCEMHEHVAQNKRHLGDQVEKLLAEARDPTDTFEDIPLDTRHHTFKHKPQFPKAWRMTDERRQALQAARAEAFLLDQQRLAAGTIVDGAQRVHAAALAPAPTAAAERVPVRAGKGGGGGGGQKKALR